MLQYEKLGGEGWGLADETSAGESNLGFPKHKILNFTAIIYPLGNPGFYSWRSGIRSRSLKQNWDKNDEWDHENLRT